MKYLVLLVASLLHFLLADITGLVAKSRNFWTNDADSTKWLYEKDFNWYDLGQLLFLCYRNLY